MRSRARKILGPLVVLLVLAWPSAPAFAVPLTVAPPALSVAQGQTFSLDVSISGVTDLFAFQFNLAFNPAVLAATGMVGGPFLPSGGPTFFIPGIIDNTSGTITFTADTLLGPVPGVSGSGTLAIATFSALAFGMSPITISGVLLLDSTLSPIPASLEGGTVTVQVAGVPEPATFVLLGSGLLVLGAWGLMQRTKQLAVAPISPA